MAEIQRAMQEAETKKNSKFEYDSDEDTEGGTWEHKARTKEMEKTSDKARELTEMNKGKHHIGDFLPPEELAKFVETVSAVKEDRTPGTCMVEVFSKRDVHSRFVLIGLKERK